MQKFLYAPEFNFLSPKMECQNFKMFYVCLVVFTMLKPTVVIEERKRKESKYNSIKYT